jgi:hypothetical protein
MESYEELERKMIDAVGREKTEEIRQMGFKMVKEFNKKKQVVNDETIEIKSKKTVVKNNEFNLLDLIIIEKILIKEYWKYRDLKEEDKKNELGTIIDKIVSKKIDYGME